MYAGCPGKDVADGDDVIFPFLDMFWLHKLVSLAKISLTKKLTPGLFFLMLAPPWFQVLWINTKCKMDDNVSSKLTNFQSVTRCVEPERKMLCLYLPSSDGSNHYLIPQGMI